jgi:rubrerythrin
MGIFDQQKALKASIQTEKDAMDFYKFGAEKMPEDKARQTFELLAREEIQHARMFYQAYKGGDQPPFEQYIQGPPDTGSSWWKALQQAMLGDFDERKALELAIEQEEALEQELRAIAEKIGDPDVKAIYLANASSTHHHLLLVEEEYTAMFGMSR